MALAVVGAFAWRLGEATVAALELAGGDRRFTGSSGATSGTGNDYPVTMWLADDPDPIDRQSWDLTVAGAVASPRSFSYEELAGSRAGTASTGDAAERAVLDCTSGWYADREWQGVRVGDLLEAVDPDDDVRWVRFQSVTGYRWSLPVEEAREAVLATHVGGERLTHGHGRPLRLVAPGRRGFQWVKWVDRVQLRRHRDPGQWATIFLSGFDFES